MIWVDLGLLGFASVVYVLALRQAKVSLGHLDKAKELGDAASALLVKAQGLLDEAKKFYEPDEQDGLAEAQRIATEANARERARRGLA